MIQIGGTGHSELIDFDALELDSSGDRHGELLRRVTELLGLVGDRCSPTLLETYDAVLLRLVASADRNIRGEVARQLAGLRQVPGGIVRTLALDEIVVAQPLLIRSPALGDDDLIAISEIRGKRHRRAIAVRPDLGAAVAMAILEQGDDSVRRTLAGNATAQLSRRAFERLLAQAAEDRAMQAVLVERDSLPEWVRSALSKLVGHEIGGETDGPVRPSYDDRSVARAAAAGAWTLRIEAMFGRYDFVAAEKAMPAGAAAPAIEAISKMADENRFADVAVALARLSGFALHEVLGWFAKRDVGAVLAVLRAHGASADDCRRVVTVGPWRPFITSEVRDSLLDEVGRMSRKTALGIVSRMRYGEAA